MDNLMNSEEMAGFVTGVWDMLAQQGRRLPRDERYDELQEVMAAANYKALVSINSNCPVTTNGSAQYDLDHHLHHQVRINDKLNRKLMRSEAKALIAHEVSHLKRRHTLRHRKIVARVWRTSRRGVRALVAVSQAVVQPWWPHRHAGIRNRLLQSAKYLRVATFNRVSQRHEYQADADVLGWLGPSYALPLAHVLDKATELARQKPQQPWRRTHPPLEKRLKAIGVTPEQLKEYRRSRYRQKT